MKRKVLVLGVAAVQADAILELKRMGYETHACAMAKDGPGGDIADYFAEINILDKENIISYMKENSISVVYSVGSDHAIPMACNISEELKLPHFVSEKTANICNNKDLLRHTLGSSFEGNVKFQVIKEKNSELELKFPFIIKPTDSQGQRGVQLITSEEEYIKAFDEAIKHSRKGTVILEQYIDGPEISVNGYLVNGELKYLTASDRETWPMYTGLIKKHIVPSNKLTLNSTMKLEEIMKSACNKLKIENGPVYAQIKIEEEIPYIIEITPRLDGCHMWKLLNLYEGINLLELTFNHLINNDVSEIENLREKSNKEYVLEFICQTPKEKADYNFYQQKMENSLGSYKYYQQGELIRPINGKHDKIGYFIY